MKITSLSKSKLIERYPKLLISEPEILKTIDLMIQCYSGNGKVYICGNGGSAADAEHFSGELNKGFILNRPLTNNEKVLFENINPEIPTHLQRSLPTIPLTSFYSTVSAFQNDCHPKYHIAQLVWSLVDQKDLLIGITTSGNSENIYYGFQTAKAKGIKTVLLTGEKRGRCADYSDISINVPSQITHEIQEYHLPVYHSICMELESYFFS